MDLDKFLEELGKIESHGRSGGGGYVCRFDFRVGFFIYSGEVDRGEKAYVFEPGNEEAMEQALVDAGATLAKYELDKLTGKEKQRVGPHPSYITTLYQDSVKGAAAERAKGWEQGDRVFATPMWSDAAHEIWIPAIKELALMPGVYWGRLTFREDPDETRVEADGSRKLVAYPAELYANEAEAEEAAGGDGDESSGLSPKLAKAVKADVDALVSAGKPKAEAVKDVATDWQITEDAVLAVI